MGDGQQNAGISAIHLDSLGNIYTTGWFWGTKDFNPSNQGTLRLTALGGTDIFIQKLSPNGSLLWAQKYGGTGNDKSYDITTDSRLNVYAATHLNGLVPGIPNSNQTFYSGGLLKYSGSGLFTDYTLIGSSVRSVSLDQQDNIYTTGYFTATKDFDPDTSNSLLFTSQGVENGFIHKLDNNHNLIWAHHLSSSGSAYGISIEVDKYGALTLAGQFTNSITLNSNQSSQTFTSQSNFSNTFIQKLDFNGNSIWSGQISDSARPTDLAIDQLGNTICIGLFKGNADFNPNDSSYFINGGQKFNTFTLKLRKCIVVDSIDVISCNSYRWQHNNQLLRKSGLYSDTIISSTYCDSASALNLSIDVNSTVTVGQNADTLIANDTNALYQWIDCTNGNTAIIGDTNRIFIPPHSGSFAVVLTTNSCVDTSRCIPYTIVNLNKENLPDQNFRVFPNPTNGALHYQSYIKNLNHPIQVYSTTGQLVYEKKLNQPQGKIDLRFLENGLYVIKQNNHLRKVIISK